VDRNIATGTVNLGYSAAFTVPAGTVALAYINQINQTAEGGRVFMSRGGVFTFEERIGNTLSAPVVEFSNDGVETPYNDLTIEFDGSDVVNRAVVTNLDGTTSTAQDTDSITTYGHRTLIMDNSLLETGAAIATYATYLLYPDPEAVFTSVQTSFPACSSSQRDELTVVDIGDTIEITAALPGAGTTLTQESAVEGIEASIDFRRGHTARYYVSKTTIVYDLILDNVTYGVLDSTNVLG